MAVPDEDDGMSVVVKKTAWTKEEDAVLREQVRLHGAQNWAAISEALAERNPKSCRLRWCQHLNPIVDTSNAFTREEDEKIVAFYRLFPNKWATIAGFLPGRTDNAIKNRWHSCLGKKYQPQRAVAPIRRLYHGALVLFPWVPGDVRALRRGDPVLGHPPPSDEEGVDLSGECLNLFPLVPGDLAKGNNTGEPAAMDVDSKHESLVELRLCPSTAAESLAAYESMAAFKRMVHAVRFP